MRKGIYLAMLLFLGLIVACKTKSKSTQEKGNTALVRDTTVHEVTPEPEVIEEPKKALITADDYVNDFYYRKAKLIEKLKTATPQFANYLYLDFRKENELLAAKLWDLEIDLLDNYETLYTDEGELKYNSKNGSKIRKYNSNGLQLWYIGEGMTEVRVNPKVYPEIFQGKVTPDYENYILLCERDDEQLITNDAAIVISIKELANILIRWEKFIQKYPNSNIKKEAIQMYETYQMWYLFGLDNTPTRDYEAGKLYDEYQDEFERFLANHPTSPTTTLVKMMLQGTGNTADLRTKVTLIQNQILRKL